MRVPTARAIFDLEHLDGVSDAPNLLLIVSERTLYLLQNLVTLDTADHVRYVIERYGEGEYVPVAESDVPEWALFSDVADKAAQEIIEVGRMPLYGITEAIGTIDTYPVPGAGNYTQAFGPVPVGEMWEVQAIQGMCGGSVASVISIQLQSEWTSVGLKIAVSPASYESVIWVGRAVLSEGQKIEVYYGGVAAGSTLYTKTWFCKLVQ